MQKIMRFIVGLKLQKNYVVASLKPQKLIKRNVRL